MAEDRALCIQLRTEGLKHWRAFAFLEYERKFEPAAMRVVVDFIVPLNSRVVKLCVVYTLPISEMVADFITNIPVRMRKMLPSEVEISVLYSGKINQKRLLEKGIAVHEVPIPELFKRLLPIQLFFLAMVAYRLGRNGEVDIFINANEHHFLFVPAFGAALAGKRVVARIAGMLPVPKDAGAAKRARKGLGGLLTRLSLSLSCKGICLSGHLRDRLISLGVPKARLLVLSQGVDTGSFRPGRRKRSEVSRLLFVGRLTPNKGVETLLEAFLQLREKHSNMVLTICGNGPLKGRLEAKYWGRKDVVFLGHVSHEDLPRIYQEADIMVLPSFSEGLPNVVLEAMASGVPVVASRVGDNPVLLESGNRGILIEPRSATEIREAVERFLLDRHFYDSCAREGRAFALREHGFESLANRYVSLFREISG